MHPMLVEVAIASLLAAVLGYLLDEGKGGIALFFITLLTSLVTFFAMQTAYTLGYLPLNHLGPITQVVPNSYLGTTFLSLELFIWIYLLSSSLGYVLNNWGVGLIFAFGSFIGAIAVLLTGIQIGLENSLNPIVLLRTIQGLFLALVFILSVVLISVKKSGAVLFVWGIVYGIAALRWGLPFLIAFPALFSFIGAFYIFSQKLLPIDNSQRFLALKSLQTFLTGTNCPYYRIGDWKTQDNKDQKIPEPCVPGNAFNRSPFIGPGIVLNDCNHSAVISDGFTFKVLPPGVNFTGRFEQFYAVVDLRPQLRVTKVDAETRDGIVTNTLIFMPHRIDVEGRGPELGRSYPYNAEATEMAVCNQALVDHKWYSGEKGMIEETNLIPWDELVLMKGPAILKNIIVDYNCNNLHIPGDPRVAIAGAFVDKLKAKMKPLGIELVGGGISNIDVPKEVMKQRIENWKAAWKHKIEIEIGKAKAESARQLETVWVEAQLELLEELTQLLSRSDSVVSESLFLQLLDALLTAPAPEAEGADIAVNHKDSVRQELRRLGVNC